MVEAVLLIVQSSLATMYGLSVTPLYVRRLTVRGETRWNAIRS